LKALNPFMANRQFGPGCQIQNRAQDELVEFDDSSPLQRQSILLMAVADAANGGCLLGNMAQQYLAKRIPLC
jgi:hypothetical protein